MSGVFCHQVVYKTDDGVAHSEGLAILSHLPIINSKAIPYTNVSEKETSEISVKDLPEHNTDKGYINKQHYRKLLVAVIENEGEKLNISTTHFTWAYYGHFDKENKKFIWKIDEGTVNEQTEDAKRLFDIFDTFPDIVFCADLNAPRGEKIFDMFAHKLKDNIPEQYKRSIDENIHRLKAPLPLMIDGVFTTKEYEVSNVILKNGISDHMAVVCELSK
ncbi:MAG: hypothetical protein M3Q34_04725 [bacterium]|nr:hypothetical protein [bacterium]